MKKVHSSQFKVRSRRRGQMLVVILLVMIVGMTVGLFLTSRTTTDIALTTRVTESSRAFNAAEAGIEEAIRSITAIPAGSPVPFAPGLTYTVTATDLGTGGIYPATRQLPVNLNDAFTLWLVPHDEVTGELIAGCPGCYFYTNDVIHVCFTDNTTPPAIDVTFFYLDILDGNRIKSSAAAYDINYLTRGAGFKPADITLTQCGGGAGGYNYHAALSFLNDFKVDQVATGNRVALALRIRPIYAATSIAVNPVGINLPKQGNDIFSTGISGIATRRINVQEPYTVLPPFMDYAIYSTGNIPLSK